MDWRTKACVIHETVVKRYPVWSEEDQQFLTLALAGEVGEFANIIKKRWRGDFETSQVRDQLEDELADIRIYLELLAMSFGVDLDAACEAKMADLERRWPEAAAAIARKENGR